MDNVENILQQLKDIHQPPAVSWLPLAPGWYVVLILAIIALLFLGYGCWRLWRKYRMRRIALRELENLKQAFHKNADKQYVASHLSILLRRVCLFRFSRHIVAGLEGVAWLEFLDKVTDTEQFTHGDGHALISAPYALQVDDNLDRLFTLVEQTIKRCV